MELIKNIIEKLRRWRFNRWVNAGNKAGWVHRTRNNSLTNNSNGDGIIHCKFPIENPSEQLPPEPRRQMNPPMKRLLTNPAIKRRLPARPPAKTRPPIRPPKPPEKSQLKTDNNDNKKQKETKDNE